MLCTFIKPHSSEPSEGTGHGVGSLSFELSGQRTKLQAGDVVVLRVPTPSGYEMDGAEME